MLFVGLFQKSRTKSRKILTALARYGKREMINKCKAKERPWITSVGYCDHGNGFPASQLRKYLRMKIHTGVTVFGMTVCSLFASGPYSNSFANGPLGSLYIYIDAIV